MAHFKGSLMPIYSGNLPSVVITMTYECKCVHARVVRLWKLAMTYRACCFMVATVTNVRVSCSAMTASYIHYLYSLMIFRSLLRTTGTKTLHQSFSSSFYYSSSLIIVFPAAGQSTLNIVCFRTAQFIVILFFPQNCIPTYTENLLTFLHTCHLYISLVSHSTKQNKNQKVLLEMEKKEKSVELGQLLCRSRATNLLSRRLCIWPRAISNYVFFFEVSPESY